MVEEALQSARAFYEGAKSLPSTAVSKEEGPTVFVRLTDHAKKVYERVYYSMKIIHQRDQQSEKRVRQVVEEPTILKRNDAVSTRDLFVAALLRRYDTFSINYRIEGTDNRLSENVVLLISLLDVYIAMTLPASAIAQINTFRAIDVVYLRENDLANSANRITDYSLSELMRALYQLCARWNQLRFSDSLIAYIDVLRIRIGQFLHQSFSGWIHDVPALRVLIPDNEVRDLPQDLTDAEYQAGPAVRTLFTCILKAMLTKLSYTRLGEWVEFEQNTDTFVDLAADYGIDMSSPEWAGVTLISSFETKAAAIVFSGVGEKSNGLIPDSVVSANRCSLFRRWLEYRINVMQCDTASQILRRDFLNMSLRPGERENFTIICPEDVATVHNILRKFRGPEFLKLWDQADRTIPEVIAAELDMHPEPLSLSLVLTDFIGTYVSAQFFPLRWQDYVIFENELAARETDPVNLGKTPCILQLCNHFQLYYLGKVYRFDSMVRSILAWLHIVRTRLHSTVAGLSIEEWYKEMADVESGKKCVKNPILKKKLRKHKETLEADSDMLDAALDNAMKDEEEEENDAAAEEIVHAVSAASADSDEVMSVL